MNETIASWLEQLQAKPGWLACGVCFADRTCRNQSFHSDFPIDSVTAVLHQIEEMLAALHQHLIAPTRLVWSYERVRLAIATRADGILFGLFLEAEVEAESCEGLLEEFLRLGEVPAETPAPLSQP